MPDRLGPWTLKAVHPNTRRLALEASSKLQLGITEWVTRAIENQAALDERSEVLPPEDERLPVLYESRQVDLNPFVELLRAVSAADPDAGKSLAREVVSTARVQLKRARGAKAR